MNMNISSAIESLLKWFNDNDSFNINTNFKELFPNYVSNTPEADKAAILCALDELIDAKILKKKEINNEDYWILTQPLSSVSQNITLNSQTCLIISEIINKTRETSENFNSQISYCNPLEITEKDILTSIAILSELAKNNNNNNNNI